MDEPDLEALIAEVLTDAYGHDEELGAWESILGDELEVPFTTTVLGREVTVTRIELPEHGAVCAVCTVDGHRQRVPLTDLPLPEPPPAGAEWIAAYRLWGTGT